MPRKLLHASGKLFSLVMHEQANILVIRLPQVRNS